MDRRHLGDQAALQFLGKWVVLPASQPRFDVRQRYLAIAGGKGGGDRRCGVSLDDDDGRGDAFDQPPDCGHRRRHKGCGRPAAPHQGQVEIGEQVEMRERRPREIAVLAGQYNRHRRPGQSRDHGRELDGLGTSPKDEHRPPNCAYTPVHDGIMPTKILRLHWIFVRLAGTRPFVRSAAA